MIRIALPILAAAALAACAGAPEREPPPRAYQLAGGVKTTFLPLADVNRECELRIGNRRIHWGCATYDRKTDSCDIVAAPLRHKADWDRAAVLGIELNNCNRIRAGEPDE